MTVLAIRRRRQNAGIFVACPSRGEGQDDKLGQQPKYSYTIRCPYGDFAVHNQRRDQLVARSKLIAAAGLMLL